MATFQVPVWFNVEAKNYDDAWQKIFNAMVKARETIHESDPNIDDYTVEDPVLINAEEV